MRILGISCFYHDAAAAIVCDGVLQAASSEERISRKKHDPELPVGAVRYCLKRTGLEINDLDHVVFYDKPLLKFERILTGYMANPFRSYKAFLAALPIWLRRKLWVDYVIHKELGYDGEALFLPHHLSHAAGAFYCSPFEQAAILTIDGVGEWANASYGVGDNNRVRLIDEMHYPHSVGLIYSAMTYYLGFRVNSAEYKIMGLAPYGTPRYADLIEEKLVTIHDDGSIHLNLDYFTYCHGLTMTGPAMEKLFGQPRRNPESDLQPFHNDVAASIQKVTEKIVLRMARHVREKTGMNNLCMAGGVALNCRANGLLLREQIFDNIYIQPAAGDSGGAVGAALYTHYQCTKDNKRPQPFWNLGPVYDDDEIGNFLDRENIPHEAGDVGQLATRAAKAVADGKIVAIFQGAAEFGPRALGFRSIVADPRDNTMKEKINAAVKYREPFRPFAPAVMAEHAADYFDCQGESPFMLFNFNVHSDKRATIPAVTHVDNSSRIQTVSAEDNPIFHRLIDEFRKLTGVAVVLNTSFNLRGHPIVNTPEDAFATFCSGGIDFVLLGGYIVDKRMVSGALLRKFKFEKSDD
ncbi:MAG: carbamoyltransferase [candidate division Zixibacteria bacterium]|nr:carbamoyltransferase [candidate division Zixibacteria bacterium]